MARAMVGIFLVLVLGGCGVAATVAATPPATVAPTAAPSTAMPDPAQTVAAMAPDDRDALDALSTLLARSAVLSGADHRVQVADGKMDDWRDETTLLYEQVAAVQAPIATLTRLAAPEKPLPLRCTATAGQMVGVLDLALASDLLQAVTPAPDQRVHLDAAATDDAALSRWLTLVVNPALKAQTGTTLAAIRLPPERVNEVMAAVPSTKVLDIPAGCQ